MVRTKQPSRGPVPLEYATVESGAVVKAGSDLLINSGDEDMPYVAHVIQVLADKKDNASLKVFWYYFPDDVPRGRQPYHARNEIFKSNHQDEISSKSVIWTCTVLSLEKWVGFLATEANPGVARHNGPVEPDEFDIDADLAASKTKDDGAKNKSGEKGDEKMRDEDDEEDDKAIAVYMSRHEFDAVKEQWKDVEVAVFCVCNLPYNPDLDMILCARCNEWYHPACLEMTDDEVKSVGTGKVWKCPNCKSEGTVGQ